MGSSKASLLSVISNLAKDNTFVAQECEAYYQVCAIVWRHKSSGDSRSKSHRLISSFAEKKNLVLKCTPKINDMQIFEFLNCNPRP